MRSVYASMLALALTVLLCACVSRVPVWETVDDEFVCQMPRRPSTIVFAVPDGWASDVFSPGGLSRQYTAPDGSYEISATVFETSDPESAIRQLTGLDASRFDPHPHHALFSSGIPVRVERGNGRRRPALPCGDALRRAILLRAVLLRARRFRHEL